MVLKFLAPHKFKLNFDFCCAIAPRRNKTGVDIIDLIFFNNSKKAQILVSQVGQDVEALSALVFIYTFGQHFFFKFALFWLFLVKGREQRFVKVRGLVACIRNIPVLKNRFVNVNTFDNSKIKVLVQIIFLFSKLPEFDPSNFYLFIERMSTKKVTF